MTVRNGKEIAEFRTNAKLNFCHAKMTLKVKKSNLLIAKPYSGYR